MDVIQSSKNHSRWFCKISKIYSIILVELFYELQRNANVTDFRKDFLRKSIKLLEILDDASEIFSHDKKPCCKTRQQLCVILETLNVMLIMQHVLATKIDAGVFYNIHLKKWRSKTSVV